MGKKKARRTEAKPAAAVPSQRAPAAPSPYSRSRWVVAGVLVALAVALAVGLPGFRSAGPTAVRRDPGLSVLLVTIDTLRADALGSYGHPTVATPWMDRLAASGVRFAEARAQNVVTLPSHANILSGRYPLDHGVRDNAGFRFPPGAPTLATLLQKAGYRTGAFVSAFPLDSRFGLDPGFDVYDDRLGDPESRTAFLMQERSGRETMEAARRWLLAQGGAKTFLWVHLYEPHFPYVPPEPFASRFASDLYHGEVSYTDALLQPLLEPLLEKDQDRRTLVVLTGDHGEGLGEHGEATHGIFAYESTLRVPLILFAPALLAPRVVTGPVRHIDILPTALDALGLEAPSGLPGRSLLAAANGHDLPPAPSYFEAMSSALNRGWAPLAGLVRDRYKLIDLPLPELFDLAQDPHEAKNLAAAEPQRLGEIRAQLARVRETDRGLVRSAESAETRERLRALGYLAGSSAPSLKARYTDADDPKRLIGLEAEVQEVVTLYQAGDLGSALVKAQQVVKERPDMSLALQQLGFLQREVGELEAAVATLKRAVGANPDDTSAVALLGAYLNESGHAREAADVLRLYAERPEPDLDVLMARGAALAQLGRTKEALATFERALVLDPTNAQAKANIGTVHLLTRDYPRARIFMEEALALDPDVARAHNALGVIAAETGKDDEAIRHWTRAVELNPREWDTVFNLGKLLRRAGRPAEARPYLESFLHGAPPAFYQRDLDQVAGWLGSRQ